MTTQRTRINRFGETSLTITARLRDEINRFVKENGGKKNLIPASEIHATIIQGLKHDLRLTILSNPPRSVEQQKAAHRRYYRFLDARGYYYLSVGCKLKDGKNEEDLRAIRMGAPIQQDPDCPAEIERETRRYKDREQVSPFPDIDYGRETFFKPAKDGGPTEKAMVLFAALFKDEVRDEKFLRDHHDEILALRKRLFPADTTKNPDALETDL